MTPCLGGNIAPADFLGRIAVLPTLVVAGILALLLWPSEAWAWGPLAHAEFGRSALDSVSGLSPGLRILLQRCWPEFLYGSLAADLIVGKNLSRWAVHCHNWRVGLSVLDRARGEAQTALAHGFLAHLAADTVAHNYYVPYKTIEGHGTRGAGHAYWELRYDQKLDPGLWRLLRFVTRRQFRRHGEFLRNALADSAVIPFSVGKHMFGSLLFAAKLKRWQTVSHFIAGERRVVLLGEEVDESRAMAVKAVCGLLQRGENADCLKADPTGGRNLAMAKAMRRQLRLRADVTESEKEGFVAAARPAFRDGIRGPLILPCLPDRQAVAA